MPSFSNAVPYLAVTLRYTNNTVAHSGVMAIWQGRAAYADH